MGLLQPDFDRLIQGTRCRDLWINVILQAIKDSDVIWLRSRHARDVFNLAGFDPDLADRVVSHIEGGGRTKQRSRWDKV
jgi:hypothetical protein